MIQKRQTVIDDPNILDLSKGQFAALLDTLRVRRRGANGEIQEFAESRRKALRVGAKIKPVKHGI